MTRLPMHKFLAAVEAHEHLTREALIAEGYHPKAIMAKAVKAARHGYTDYGTIADRPWLTDKGREFLRVQRPAPAGDFTVFLATLEERLRDGGE